MKGRRILSSYFIGFNLSNQQINKELDLNKDDVQSMTRGTPRKLDRLIGFLNNLKRIMVPKELVRRI